MANKKEVKQVNGIHYLTGKHPIIKKIKKDFPAEIHGHKHWGSAFLLMEYFKKHPPKKGTKVLELGAGWGLTSIYLRKKYGCKVTALDADDNVFPYLEAHADINSVEVSTLCKKFEKLSEKELAKYDWIIGGDICFWDSLSDILFKVIKRAKKAKVKKVIIADPERSPFWNLVDRCLKKVDADMEVVEQKTKKPRKLSGQLLVIDF